MRSTISLHQFISFDANVAPRLALKFWELLRDGKYDAFDQLFLEYRFDPFIGVIRPEEQSWVGMGEGPTSRARLRAMGMEAGPSFPAQAELTEAYTVPLQQAIDASGIKNWVEWDQSLFD